MSSVLGGLVSSLESSWSPPFRTGRLNIPPEISLASYFVVAGPARTCHSVQGDNLLQGLSETNPSFRTCSAHPHPHFLSPDWKILIVLYPWLCYRIAHGASDGDKDSPGASLELPSKEALRTAGGCLSFAHFFHRSWAHQVVSAWCCTQCVISGILLTHHNCSPSHGTLPAPLQ